MKVLSRALLLGLVLLSSAHAHRTRKQSNWPLRKQCSVDSPGYLIDREIVPWLHKTLDELSDLSVNLLDKINEGVAHLEPHVDRSPMFELNRDEYFENVKQNIFGYFQSVHEETVTAWSNFSRVNERFGNRMALIESPYACAFAVGSVGGYHPYEKLFDDLVHMVNKIQEVHNKSSSILRSVLQELSITTQAIIMNSLTMLMESLRLNEVDSEDGKRLMENNIDRVTPNFMGNIFRKIMKTGSDPDNYKKINKEVLAQIEDVHLTLLDQLKEISSKCYDCSLMNKLFTDFWRTQAHASSIRRKGLPIFSPDVKTIYQNEEFLSEVTLSLMASFKYTSEMGKNTTPEGLVIEPVA